MKTIDGSPARAKRGEQRARPFLLHLPLPSAGDDQTSYCRKQQGMPFFCRCARSASPNVDPFSDDMDWTCSTFEAADLGKASLAFAPSPVKGAGAQARRWTEPSKLGRLGSSRKGLLAFASETHNNKE